MKSLLQTLPKAQVVELWGAKMRTNLDVVVEYSMTGKKPEGPILRFLMETYSDVEMQDLLVGKATATKRGRKITFRAQSKMDRRTRTFKVKREMELSKCKNCGNSIYVESESPEKQIEFHKKRCPVVAVIEVMES